MLDMKSWVRSFVDAYRFEGNLLEKQRTACFWPYIKEQMLIKPCSVEVLEVWNPYRLVLAFILDKSRKDLSMHISKCSWSHLRKVTSKLIEKYASVQLDQSKIYRTLVRARQVKSERPIAYGIDGSENFLCIYFTEDPRIFKNPICEKESGNFAERTARGVFHLNRSQAEDFWANLSEDDYKRYCARFGKRNQANRLKI